MEISGIFDGGFRAIGIYVYNEDVGDRVPVRNCMKKGQRAVL
jgi:hypothetical protein